VGEDVLDLLEFFISRYNHVNEAHAPNKVQELASPPRPVAPAPCRVVKSIGPVDSFEGVEEKRPW